MWHAMTSVCLETPAIISVRNNISKCIVRPGEAIPHFCKARDHLWGSVANLAGGCGSFAVRTGKEKDLPVLIWILHESDDRESVPGAASVCARDVCFLFRRTGVKIAYETPSPTDDRRRI